MGCTQGGGLLCVVLHLFAVKKNLANQCIQIDNGTRMLVAIILLFTVQKWAALTEMLLIKNFTWLDAFVRLIA